MVGAAFAALTCQSADLVVWDGLSMSAWTNTQARWKNPRVTADGLNVEAVAHDPQLYAKPLVPFIAQGNQYVEITVRCSQTGERMRGSDTCDTVDMIRSVKL